MKEYIVQYETEKIDNDELFYNKKICGELVRCKDCENRKKNKFCLKNMKYKNDDGYCDEAVRKEE